MNYIKLLWDLSVLKRNEKKSYEQIQRLQEKKLRKILAYTYKKSAYYRRKFEEAGITNENIQTVDAAIAAFTQGGAWLDALRNYIHDNKTFVAEYIKNEIPNIRALPSQATYLLWLDCGKLLGSSSDIARFIREKNGLFLSDGRQFGGNGEQFLRINIACPRSVLENGLGRLKEGMEAYQTYAVNLC